MSLFSKKPPSFDFSAYLELVPLPSAFLDKNGAVVKANEPFFKFVGSQINIGDNIDRISGSSGGNDFEKAIKALQVSEKDSSEFGVKLKSTVESAAHVFLKKIDNEKLNVTSEIKYILTMFDTQEKAVLEQKLNHSQKMQAVGQLAGGIAHDFNNLLTAMNGFCDLLLQKHPPGDRSFPDIMQIKQNVNRAANLVRQLLAFSRKQVLKPKLVDITDALSELSNLLRRLLGEHVKLNMSHGRDLWRVLADPGQIDQVTINLAVNARDAMPRGGSLTIHTSNVEFDHKKDSLEDFFAPDPEDTMLDGEYVLIQIIDTGTGMSREVMSKIFEPFFSTKEVGAGTGLGLATVYGIVKQTGGYILVKSREGEGTEFRIYFKRADEVKFMPDTEDEAKKSISQDLTGTETILIVEDEVPVRIFASRALSNKGYKVIEAESAEAALEIVEKDGSKLDLIISDVIMPGMNGPTMVKEIQKTNPQLKVIFMSGYTEDALADYDGKPEELNFLQKPFSLKDLAAKVKEVISKK